MVSNAETKGWNKVRQFPETKDFPSSLFLVVTEVTILLKILGPKSSSYFNPLPGFQIMV